MSESCVRCGEVIVNQLEVAKCTDCNGLFHPACCGQSLDAVRKLRSGSRKWRCVACKSETASTQSRSDPDITEPSTVVEMFKTLRRDMSKNMEESRKRFDGLDVSFREVKTAMEEFKAKIHVLEQDRDKLKERYEAQEKRLKEASWTIRRLEKDVHDLQQYSRRNNLEIKGIPLSTKEDVYCILEYTAKSLNLPYNRQDISTAHRLPSRNQDIPVIIVAFISRSVRDSWLAAAKKRRLNTKDISVHLADGPVFVNPHLTGYNKALLGRAKHLAREKKLHSAWTKDGKVMFRLNEKGPVKQVHTMEDLDILLI